ncbi:hypothetical protein D3C81_802410 [compost metagenome]
MLSLLELRPRFTGSMSDFSLVLRGSSARRVDWLSLSIAVCSNVWTGNRTLLSSLEEWSGNVQKHRIFETFFMLVVQVERQLPVSVGERWHLRGPGFSTRFLIPRTALTSYNRMPQVMKGARFIEAVQSLWLRTAL